MRTGLIGVAAALLLAAASPARLSATTITFDDPGVGAGSRLVMPAGVGVVSFGFNYTPGPNNASHFNNLILDNNSIGPSDHSTVVGSHDDAVLTRVGGGTFSLLQFDYAGFKFGEVPFSVVGSIFGGGNITANFTPDGISDNTGPLVDFETFSLGAGWTNLTDVTWNVTGEDSVAGLFYLDNITVDEEAASPSAVPEPGTLLLCGTGILGLARHRRAKRVQ